MPVTTEYLTTSDAARAAGKTPDTIRSWEREGVLSAIRTVSGQRLFVLDDVMRAKHLKEHRVRADRA